MTLRSIATETVTLVERGAYLAPSGREVQLAAHVAAAKAGTLLYRPGDYEALVAELASLGRATRVRLELTPETTAAAARRLVEVEREARVVALNFASAKNPGGGFLGGAKAQEEDLARCSALYACQLTQPSFYRANRACASMLYTDHLIYAPDVPFFRDERHTLLEAPFPVSVITSPAPNAGEAYRRQDGDAARRALQDTLRARARHVLAVAAKHEHRCLVLGAWGCGVFRNDPREVADAFAVALEEERFARAFERVVFAIWERVPERPFLRVFAERLGVTPSPSPPERTDDGDRPRFPADRSSPEA